MKIESLYLSPTYGTLKVSEDQSQIEVRLNTQEIFEWLEAVEPLIKMKITGEKKKISVAVLNSIRPTAEIEGEVQ